MADKARAAALLDIFEAHFTAIEADEDRDYIVRGLLAVHDAGVAEGTRRAKEAAEAAVAGEAFLDDGAILTLRAIDALTREEADRG